MIKTNCRYCGLGFSYPKQFGNVKYCSSRCRVSHHPPQNPWEYKGCNENFYGKSRRRKMAAGDKIDYLVIYEYYDWVCCLCDKPIDRNLLHPDPMCGTIDHEREIGSGGSHTWTNVKPAHLRCNQEKNEKNLQG